MAHLLDHVVVRGDYGKDIPAGAQDRPVRGLSDAILGLLAKAADDSSSGCLYIHEIRWIAKKQPDIR